MHNTFGAAESIADRLARAAQINQDNGVGLPGIALASYQHNGTARVARVKYDQANIERQMYSSAGNYDSWDRFGRTVTHAWKTTGGTVRDQAAYSYDFAGNRLTRAVAGATSLDQTYTYDGLHRLRSVDELTAANDRFWKLDQLGNWDKLYNNTTGTGTALEERTHNGANELTAFTTPAATIGPISDLAGNMTTIPSPKDATKKLDRKFDAWNRMVEAKNDAGVVVQTSEFDGLNRRVVRDETGGSGNHRHFYYNQQWQVLEERLEVAGTVDPQPLSQYVYHPEYVDSIAVRFYDANTDGAGIVRHYYLQDANFNVTAITDSAGAVVER